MQNVVPVSGRNPNGHTETEIRAALAGLTGSRKWTFHYSLLNSSNQVLIENLDNVIGCKVEQNWLADIKRTAVFTVRETGAIDYLTHRIQPRARLHLPPYGAQDWVEWPMGVFLLSSPKRKAESTGLVTREVTGFDMLQVYADDAAPTRYTMAKNANMITTVSNVLGSVRKIITPQLILTPAARSWDPGTTKLRIINDILGTINYDSLSFDELGQAIVRPYRDPASRALEWTYADDDYGLLVPGMENTLDLGSVPNQVIVVCSSPDRPLLTAKYTNANPASVTSTVRRGRVIAVKQDVPGSPSQAYLNLYALTALRRLSQIYEAVEFDTGLNPLHSGHDIYRLRYGPLNLNATYVEQSWSVELKVGAKMRHVARRVVTV